MANESIKPTPETSEDAPTSEIDDSASIKFDGKDNTTSLRIVSDIKDLDLFDEGAIAQYELLRAHQIANDQGGPDSGGIDKLEDEETQTEVEDLSSLSVLKLKERCKAAGLQTSGTKSMLIGRLSEENEPEVDLDNDEIEDSDTLKKLQNLLSEAGFHLDKAGKNYKVKKDEKTQTEGEDLSSLTVAQLKKLLKEAELPVSGSKSELINRLKENSEVNLDDNSNEEVLETQNEGE